MAHTTNPTEIVVVGGGMAGLASALGLRKNGAAVTLLEQAPEFGEVGAGLQMAPNATRALKKWGLLDEVLELGVRPQNMIFRDALSGEELLRQSLGELSENYGTPYVVIHRSDLHGVLLRACQASGVTLINDAHVERVETVGDRARVHVSDGTVHEADFVLAADGLKSALRAAVSRDEPVTSSYVAYRGVVPMEAAALNDDVDSVTVWLGPDCHLVQYPLRKGELLNTVAVLKSASFGQGTEQLDGQEELIQAFADAVPAVQSSLGNLWQGIRWPMFDREPITNWIDGRVMLIGDAAHPMLQYLAQGACQALEDASVLQDLTNGRVFTADGVDNDAWPEVARLFVAERAPRTARVQSTARVWGESWHVSGFARFLRNMLFSGSADNVYRYSDWLYGEPEHAAPAAVTR